MTIFQAVILPKRSYIKMPEPLYAGCPQKPHPLPLPEGEERIPMPLDLFQNWDLPH